MENFSKAVCDLFIFCDYIGVTLLTASYVTLGGLLFSGVESRYLAHQAAVAAAAAESSSPVVMNSTMLLGNHIHFLCMY
jgi:hypothetical protein